MAALAVYNESDACGVRAGGAVRLVHPAAKQVMTLASMIEFNRIFILNTKIQKIWYLTTIYFMHDSGTAQNRA
jgi:hypothetical protein